MKRIAIAFILCLLALPAWAQCNGVFSANQVCGSTTAGPPKQIPFATITSGNTSFANPSAKVGLSPVNGSANTAMRSDGAPPIDLTISPSWTGTHTFSSVIVSNSIVLPAQGAHSFLGGPTPSFRTISTSNDLAPGTNSVVGVLKCDGTTTTCSGGTISNIASSALATSISGSGGTSVTGGANIGGVLINNSSGKVIDAGLPSAPNTIINNNGASNPSIPGTSGGLAYVEVDNNAGGLTSVGYGAGPNAGTAWVNLATGSGTGASISATTSNSVLGDINFWGFNGVAWVIVGVIENTVTESQTLATGRGNQFKIYTVPNGSNTKTVAQLIDQDQSTWFNGLLRSGNGVQGPTISDETGIGGAPYSGNVLDLIATARTKDAGIAFDPILTAVTSAGHDYRLAAQPGNNIGHNHPSGLIFFDATAAAVRMALESNGNLSIGLTGNNANTLLSLVNTGQLSWQNGASTDITLSDIGSVLTASSTINTSGYSVQGANGVSCPAGTVSLVTLTISAGIVTHC